MVEVKEGRIEGSKDPVKTAEKWELTVKEEGKDDPTGANEVKN